MAIYLIDYENTGVKGLYGIEKLHEEDLIVVFYGPKTGAVPFDDHVRISFCVRSSVDSEREMLNRRIGSLIKQFGGTVEVEGEYPGWEYKKDSRLRDLMIEVFKEQYGKEPTVEAIHAGLECGMFAGKIPGLDCVSIGPNLDQIHTVRENMSISSVQRVYAFVLELLKRMK